MADVPANSTKTVYYFNRVTHPVYVQTLAAQPDIELHRLTNDSADGDVAPVMAAAHAYQIDSTRAGIPEKYWANEALLARNPTCCWFRPTAPVTTPSMWRRVRASVSLWSISRAPTARPSPNTRSA